MVFLIGGFGMGKYEYLLQNGYTIDDIGDTFDYKVLYKLNEVVKKYIKDNNNASIDEFILLINHYKFEYIVYDEVGCGLMPIDPFERYYVDFVGKVACRIALEATTVKRMFCGLVTIIK